VSGERASFGHMVLLFVVMLVVHSGPQVEWEVLYLKACALGTSALHFLTELSFPVPLRGAFCVALRSHLWDCKFHVISKLVSVVQDLLVISEVGLLRIQVRCSFRAW
jgi:hypothetical protein